MESSQQPSLATESFSYSWLVNPRPTSIEPSGEELPLTHNFSFDVSISSDHSDAHADKLFSNGLLMPLFATTSNTPSTTDTNSYNYDSSCSNQIPSSSSSSSFATSSLTRHQQSIFPRKFSRFSRKFLNKYLGFLLPSCPRRRSQRVDDLDRRAQEVKSLNTTPETVSPRMSTASAYSNWSDYAESSIYEAILYCKRSSEQS